jgi:hypothetical protein
MQADALGDSKNEMAETQNERQLSQQDTSIRFGTHVQGVAAETEFVHDADRGGDL